VYVGELVALPAGPRFALPWLLRYAVSPYRVWDALIRRYRDPVFIRLPESPGTVATGCPEGVRAIVSADASTLVPWRLPSTELLLTNDSIFLQAGDRHRAVRKLLAPLFVPARQAEHCATMAAVVDSELAQLAPGPLVVQELAQRMTLQIILAVLFGLRGGRHVAAFHDAAKRALDDAGPVYLYLRVLRKRFSAFAKTLRALDDIKAMIQAELERRRAAPAACPAGHTDMLDQLMRARHADGSPLGDREIQVHLSDMIVAGHETTTVAIAWTIYELCRNPHAMAALRDELDRHGPPRDAATLAPLRYLEAACNEALRLHPPLVFLSRTVARPLHVSGHDVAPGFGVSLMLPVVHRNPATYPDPHAYRPERFVERSYGPDQFLPFGGGAKRCLGASFALQEMMIVVAGLVSRFDLRLRADRPVKARARTITVAPVGGVEVVLTRRRPTPRARPAPRDGSPAR